MPRPRAPLTPEALGSWRTAEGEVALVGGPVGAEDKRPLQPQADVTNTAFPTLLDDPAAGAEHVVKELAQVAAPYLYYDPSSALTFCRRGRRRSAARDIAR